MIFHFVCHYLTHFSEKIQNEYTITYKKIRAKADKQVRIKTHPIKRKTIPTTVFDEMEEEVESNTLKVNKPETRSSTCVLQQEALFH